MPTYSIQTTRTRCDYKHTHYFGGFITYWKLVWQMHRMLDAMNVIEVGITEYTWRHFLVVYKTPWWLFLKPLGWIFTVVTRYKGAFVVERDTYRMETTCTNESVVKTKVVKVFRFLPVWYTRSRRLTPKDWEYLLER